MAVFCLRTAGIERERKGGMIRLSVILLLVAVSAPAETWSSSSGLSIGASGVSVTTPATGQLPEVTYKDGSIQMSFSLTGTGRSGAASGPVRVVSPAAQTPSVLTDSETFFKGIGK